MMKIWNKIIALVTPLLPFFTLLLGFFIILWCFYWVFIGRHKDFNKERKFTRQIIIIFLTLGGIVGLILALPIDISSRNQLIGLVGLLISAIFAFSSTNVIANLMAGILLRITKPFRTGDFIQIGDHFGRVSERGLFDTEIQSENRELIALPNSYIIKSPVTTTRSSGTIISISLSLGYEVHYSQVEPLLLKAAEKCGLSEPFIHILELGNYSITYRISGLLTEVRWLITARTNLCKAVLDALHEQDIEIMSPTYMNQRRINEDKKVIPIITKTTSINTSVGSEDIVFDKAEQAEQIDKEKQDILNEIERLEPSLKEASEEERKEIKKIIDKKNEQLKELEVKIMAPTHSESKMKSARND